MGYFECLVAKFYFKLSKAWCRLWTCFNIIPLHSHILCFCKDCNMYVIVTKKDLYNSFCQLECKEFGTKCLALKKLWWNQDLDCNLSFHKEVQQ